ncbi:IS66 family insertion sequence hypothetical protein [Faecalicatena contorta]|uniref:IS66 family insertion sequence element accessory protein TnpA n=1 Tax=Faecalicatena contorta TaxID=39482 RepID=UPI00129EB292|nr:IS66 family insertion sequence element accessory protein TnpB [Faecalicatena contorta]MRM88999.1 IS66 family insertion sequence hypothetical protein [Faecalicatena contorta]
MLRKALSKEQWREVIQTCRNSGLSDYQWCKSNGIAASTFYKHAKKLRESACISPPSFGARTITEKQNVVQIGVDSMSSTCIEHNTPLSIENPVISLHINGIRMDIRNGADSNLLPQTLLVLKSLC